MDIDQEGELVRPESTQIILPSEAYPGIVQILPQAHRPFFPGQVVPIILNASIWQGVLEKMQAREQAYFGVVLLRRDLKEDEQPVADDLYDMGCLCRIHQVRSEGEHLQVLLEGLQRFRIRNWLQTETPMSAAVRYYPDQGETQSEEEKAYAVAIINIIKELIPLNPLYGEELKVFLTRSNPNQAALLADFAASLTSAGKEDLQAVLERINLQSRLALVVELLHKEVEIAGAQMEIRQHVEAEIQGHQREAVLKQQLKYIQKELGIAKDDKTAELDLFRSRVKELELPEMVQQRFEDEIRKLSLLETGSPEYGVTRNYLDWLTNLPWGRFSTDNLDLVQAERVLARHHEGLEDVKQRIVEFLALGQMKGAVGGSIICFVGPPGVGKTSLGRAVAEALQRRFFRFSLGGMRDEAEIKGHRRTYIGAMPGKLIQGMKDAGTANPVIMLDEIDKIGTSFQGDPASALLEVLDPEQNSKFRDHYMDVDFDLSKVLFICTANQLDTIPGPLLDRMEVIHLSGYLHNEKLAICRKHLIPRQLERAGVTRQDIKLDAAALRTVIDGYAREAGVRRLDKAMATMVRKAVVKILRGEPVPIRIGKNDVAEYLGQPVYTNEQTLAGVGIVTGLAWTSAGGATLPVEARVVHRRQAGLKLTGQLGTVMQESANIAYSYILSCGEQLGLDDFFADAFVHLHVPAGATPKDGPSAGITMASALLSLALGRAIKPGWAMTGELTLTGKVFPVGGIQEKLIAAKRQKIKRVILPAANKADVLSIEEHNPKVTSGLDIHYAGSYNDVVEVLF